MITKSLFERCFPTKGLTSPRNLRKYNLVRLRDELIVNLNIFLPKYRIDTPKRLRAFLSCGGVETDYFKTTSEYASGADYEGRRDLGNTEKGDGRRFKGGGVFQTTGRSNYYRVMVRFVKKLTGVDYTDRPREAEAKADILGVNFLKHPELLRENIAIAVESACIFWDENNLNRFADRDEIKKLNGVVNRGSANKTPLHWEKREALHKQLCTLIPNDFTFEEAENSDPSYTPPAPAESEVKPIDIDKAQAGIDKYAGTLQSPALKTVAKRAGGRLGAGLAAVWGTTGGKIALVLTAVVLVSVLAGVIYAYRKQIQLGYQIAKATIKKVWRGLF